MTFHCNSCEQERSFYADYGLLIITPKKEMIRVCRRCRTPKGGIPDVFFDGKPEENLADDPVTGKPRTFGSKGEKAAYLKEKGLREDGDKHHGAPTSYSKQNSPRLDSRHEVAMAMKKIREMGDIARRQEYLRIKKEGAERAARR